MEAVGECYGATYQMVYFIYAILTIVNTKIVVNFDLMALWAAAGTIP
jgi:hypothetical protein